MSGIAVNNYDSQQHPFLRNNRFITAQFDEPNNSGEFTLEQGQVMARDASTGKVVIHESTQSVPGGKIPVGIVGESKTMAAGATDVQVSLCVAGDVKESAVKLGGSDTLDSQVTIQDSTPSDTGYSRTIRDMIEGETLGIHLVQATELSAYDNQ